METPLSITEEPESPNGSFAIVLGPRQLAAVLVVAIFAAGIFCSLSYIVGRSTVQPVVAAARPAARAPKPLTLTPVPCPAAPAVAAPAPVQWKNADAVVGATYLQVISAEGGVADTLARGLAGQGVEAISAPGGSPVLRRVLVGPVTDQSIAAARAKLEALGFHPFVRKYQKNDVVEAAKPDSR